MDWEPDLVDRVEEVAKDSLKVSNSICIKDYVGTWQSTLTYDELSLQASATLPYQSVSSDSHAIPKDIWEELFLVTNPAETLYCEGMIPFHTVKLKDVPADVKLQTVKHTLECSKMKKHEIKYYRAAHNILTYSYLKDEFLAHKYATIKAERTKELEGSVSEGDCPKVLAVPEVIITANYGRPQSLSKRSDNKRGWPNIYLHLLGQTTLADLRDAIKCPKDFEIPGDFSLAPDDAQNKRTSKEILPSALFFIEGTFYIDTRTLKAHDYSVPIVEWLRKKGCAQEFPVKTMFKTALLDMEIKLGMPYVYIHQGNCEHIIQFSDIRLMHSNDSQLLESYPIQLSSFTAKLTICNACQTRAVKWMVVNSTFSASDPSHYCDVCFKMLHYDSTGSKTCDFQAFRFTENSFVVASS